MRTGLLATAAAITVALAGCSANGSGATAAPPVKMSDHNDADVTFAQHMIPHHQQTITLADLATQKATGQQIKLVGASVLSREAKEIEQMKSWLTKWGATQPMSADMGHDMPGMTSTKDIQALRAMQGAAFDKKWLDLLEKHLESGVAMSKTVVQSGQSPEAKTMATEIIQTQGKKLKDVQALG